MQNIPLASPAASDEIAEPIDVTEAGVILARDYQQTRTLMMRGLLGPAKKINNRWYLDAVAVRAYAARPG